MWIVATYLPSTLFSLKTSWATSSGAMGLPVPTPYAVKMALLDNCIRHKGLDEGKSLFKALREIKVRLRPPRHFVINKCFIKVARQERKTETNQETGIKFTMYGRTVGFREFTYLGGPVEIAFFGPYPGGIEKLKNDLLHINYFGKRGSFFQFQDVKKQEKLQEGFGQPINGPESLSSLGRPHLLWEMDDLGEDADFEAINVFSTKRSRTGRDRVSLPAAFPYKIACSSKNFLEFTRVEEE